VPWSRLFRVESTCTSYRYRVVANRTITRPFPRAADQPYPCPMSAERCSAHWLHDRASPRAPCVLQIWRWLGWESRHIRITNVSPRSWGPQALVSSPHATTRKASTDTAPPQHWGKRDQGRAREAKESKRRRPAERLAQAQVEAGTVLRVRHCIVCAVRRSARNVSEGRSGPPYCSS
jgi:hypothetical protein